MSWILSTAIVFLGMVALGLVIEWDRGRRRRLSVRPPDGDVEQRRAERIPARVLVNKSIAGGPKAEFANRLKVDLVLTDRRLVVGSHHGRLIEMDAARPGLARCTGPRRLAVEGDHPSGRTRVRAELVIDQAEQWAAAVSEMVAR